MFIASHRYGGMSPESFETGQSYKIYVHITLLVLSLVVESHQRGRENSRPLKRPLHCILFSTISPKWVPHYQEPERLEHELVFDYKASRLLGHSELYTTTIGGPPIRDVVPVAAVVGSPYIAPRAAATHTSASNYTHLSPLCVVQVLRKVPQAHTRYEDRRRRIPCGLLPWRVSSCRPRRHLQGFKVLSCS